MALVRIQVRRDTADNWATANPVLTAGEHGYELDTGRFKVGDGIRNWQNLPYSSGALPGAVTPPAVGTPSSGISEDFARADHNHALPASATFTSLVAGTMTVGGDLRVTGDLIGGAHKHSSSSITNWNAAVFAAIEDAITAGSNVTVSSDAQAGRITISASGGGGGGGGDVTSVVGRTGDVLVYTVDIEDFPAVDPLGGTKYLSTDGTALSWQNPFEGGGVNTVNELTGDLLLQAGANVTIVPNAVTGAIVISATTSAGTGDVTSVNGLIGALDIAAVAGSGLTVTASGSTVTLDASISYDDLTNVPTEFMPVAHTHAVTDVVDLQEFIEDTASSLLVAGTNVTLTYDDEAGTLTINAQGADAAVVVAGEAISVDDSNPGQTEVSVDGTLDGGLYEGFYVNPDPPFFSLQPESQTVTYGTAIFAAIVENATDPSYQWEKSEAGTTTWASMSNGGTYSNVTEPNLTISPVEASDNGDRFRLRVTTTDGYSLLSEVATLNTVALTITQQPIGGVEFEEATTLETAPYLNVSAAGGSTPYSYQWQTEANGLWSNVAGQTAYKIDSISGLLGVSEDSKTTPYRCRVTDDSGAVVYSESAEITIRAAIPEITADPVGGTISNGSVTLTADYKGKGVSVSWERLNPGDSDFAEIGSAGTISHPTSTVSRTTLTLTGLTGNDSGAQFRVRVSNSRGEDVSEPATISLSAPVISTQPQDVTVVENTQAVFFVNATFGGTAVTYQWQELTTGGSWTSLNGKTSSQLVLSTAETPLGRDGSRFRCIVSGGAAQTTSTPAVLTVITQQVGGDQVFTVDPQNATIQEGGSYQLRAVSTWLTTTNHYAFVRIQYDNGAIEYHPLTSGTSWHGTVTRKHQTLAQQQYTASLGLRKNCWVSVCASTSEPTAFSSSGTTHTLQPWVYARFNSFCGVSTTDTLGRPWQVRQGVIGIPVSQPVGSTCPAGTSAQYPDIPYTYVESQRARVTVAERQAFIGPVPATGFWNPPTALQFTGASDMPGDTIIAVATGEYFGSYLRTVDGAIPGWQTRNLPFAFKATRVVWAWGKWFIFGYRTPLNAWTPPQFTVIESDNYGISFRPTDMVFNADITCSYNVSFAGNRLWVTRTRTQSTGNKQGNETTLFQRTENSGWTANSIGDIGQGAAPVSFAHNAWFTKNYWSFSGTSWARFAQHIPTDANTTFHPVWLQDASQNYVLSSNGYFAPSPWGTATSNFSRVTNGANGGGPQVGDYIYFGVESPTANPAGAAFYRKGAGNPGVNERLFGHTTYWGGRQDGEWADIQIMSYVFGSSYGPDMNTNYYGAQNDPNVPGTIFLKDRMIHLFRYRYSTASPGTGRGGSIPGPPPR